MIEKILAALGWIAQIIAEWPKRQADKAQKNYANWRASHALHKDARANRARLIESVDKLGGLRDDKGKPE